MLKKWFEKLEKSRKLLKENNNNKLKKRVRTDELIRYNKVYGNTQCWRIY